MIEKKPYNIGLLKDTTSPNVITDSYNNKMDNTKFWDSILQKGIDLTTSLLKEEEEMNFMSLKSETEKLHSEYKMKLSDPKLYKNSEELNKIKEEYSKKIENLSTKYNKTKLTDKHRKNIQLYHKELEHSNDLISKQLEANEKFEQQQGQINLRIFESANNMLAHAYDGQNGIQNLSVATNEYFETIQSQVKAGFLDPSKALEMKSNQLALASLISLSTIEKNSIINSSMSLEDKEKALGNLKEKYKNNKFIDGFSKETAKGYDNLSSDTLEVYMQKNLGKITGDLDLEINKIKSQIRLAKANKGEEPEELTYGEIAKRNELLAQGDVFGAFAFEQDRLKKPVEYTKFDFLLQDPKNYFGDKLQLENPDSNTVPYNYISTSTRKYLINVMNNPSAYMEISPVEDDATVVKKLYDFALNSVSQEMGVELTEDNKFAIAKTLLGSDIAGQYLPNGFDYNIMKKLYSNKNSKMSDSQLQSQLLRAGRNKYYEYDSFVKEKVLTQALNADKTEKKEALNTTALQANSLGTFLTDVELEGKNDTFFKRTDNTMKKNIKEYIRSYYSKNGLEIKEDQLQVMAINFINEIDSNESFRQTLGLKSKAFFSQSNKEKIAQAASSGTPLILSSKELVKYGYIQQAIDEWLEDELSVQLNKLDTLYNGTPVIRITSNAKFKK